MRSSTTSTSNRISRVHSALIAATLCLISGFTAKCCAANEKATEHLINGYFSLGEGSYSKALKSLEAAIAEDPTVVQAYVGLGDALEGLNRHDKALVQYKKAIATDKTYMRGYWQCARTLNRSQRYAEAIECCNKAMSLSKQKYTLLFMYRGDGYVGLKKDKQAIEDYDTVLKLSHRQVKALLRRAYVSIRMKNYQPAVDDCTAYIKEKPAASEGYVLRASAYKAMGREDLATKDQDSVRRLDKTMKSVEDIFGQF